MKKIKHAISIDPDWSPCRRWISLVSSNWISHSSFGHRLHALFLWAFLLFIVIIIIIIIIIPIIAIVFMALAVKGL